MAKNIVLCADGTGNTVLRGRGTNVFKLFEAVDIHGHRHDPERVEQVAFYSDGVGAEGNRYARMLGGAFGFGLTGNVLRLYRDLVRSYEPGDKIFLFGFSRGAFTVRTLAGFIRTCGVMKMDREAGERDELRRRCRQAYRWYRAQSPASLQTLTLRPDMVTDPKAGLEELKAKYAHPSADVHFLGVWDTVAALGFPVESLATFWNTHIHRFKFQSITLDPRVLHARHALSIDDDRHSFHPTMWDETNHPDVRQVWFAGAHSNVGGGYPKQGMSLVALDWMMREAETCGLRFIEGTREIYQDSQNVHDHQYDPRAGLSSYYRYRARDIGAICAHANTPVRVHESVLERIRLGTEYYAPGNLPNRFDIEPYGDAQAVSQSTLQLHRVTEEDGEGESFLPEVRNWQTLKKGGYWGMLFATLVIALELAQDAWRGGRGPVLSHLLDSWETIRGALTSLPGIQQALDELSTLLASGVAYMIGANALGTALAQVLQSGLLVGAAAFMFFLVSILARNQIERHFSRRWYSRVLDARVAE